MTSNLVKDVLDSAIEKTEPVVKKAKSVAATAAKKAEPVLEAAVNAGKQFSEGFIPEIYVQHKNRQYDCAELTEKCKLDFKEKYKGAKIRSCKLYIKPEDNTVYYVINEIEDRISL